MAGGPATGLSQHPSLSLKVLIPTTWTVVNQQDSPFDTKETYILLHTPWPFVQTLWRLPSGHLEGHPRLIQTTPKPGLQTSEERRSYHQPLGLAVLLEHGGTLTRLSSKLSIPSAQGM